MKFNFGIALAAIVLSVFTFNMNPIMGFFVVVIPAFTGVFAAIAVRRENKKKEIQNRINYHKHIIELEREKFGEEDGDNHTIQRLNEIIAEEEEELRNI